MKISITKGKIHKVIEINTDELISLEYQARTNEKVGAFMDFILDVMKKRKKKAIK